VSLLLVIHHRHLRLIDCNTIYSQHVREQVVSSDEFTYCALHVVCRVHRGFQETRQPGEHPEVCYGRGDQWYLVCFVFSPVAMTEIYRRTGHSTLRLCPQRMHTILSLLMLTDVDELISTGVCCPYPRFIPSIPSVR
jgi:hypothetical protein